MDEFLPWIYEPSNNLDDALIDNNNSQVVVDDNTGTILVDA